MVKRFQERAKALSWAGRNVIKPRAPEPKKANKKCPEIGKLEDYTKKFPADHWQTWPSFYPKSWKPSSWIDGEVVYQMARETGVQDMKEAAWVRDTLQQGADTGVRGASRLPTEGRNQSSAFLHGELLADALGAWVKQELMAGPYERGQLPWSDIKIAPMSVQLKPSGAAHLIVDMSHPHVDKDKVDLNGDRGMSCNSSIKVKDFPAVMSTAGDVLLILLRYGPGVSMCKQDWADAYKNIAVRESDIRLQCVSWGDAIFVDRSLTFGMASSPGIYDRISGMIMQIAMKKAEVWRKDVYKCLDDCGNVGRPEQTEKFFEAYRETCAKTGVHLALMGDANKCFGSETHGTILGVHFNTVSWTWGFCERKINKILIQLFDVTESGMVEFKTLESLSGRLNHYKDIVSSEACWERGHLIYKVAETDAKRGQVIVDEQLRKQCDWWARAIFATTKTRNSIPDPRLWFRSQFVELYPDAAGGSTSERGRGFGGVLWNTNPRRMFYGAWPDHIQKNLKRGEIWP